MDYSAAQHAYKVLEEMQHNRLEMREGILQPSENREIESRFFLVYYSQRVE